MASFFTNKKKKEEEEGCNVDFAGKFHRGEVWANKKEGMILAYEISQILANLQFSLREGDSYL